MAAMVNTASSMGQDIMFNNTTQLNATEFVPPKFEVNLASMVNLAIGTVMTLMTFGGQILVFVVVSHDARLRDASSYYITSLALADLLVGLICMPVWTIYNTLGYWPFSQILCDIWNVLDFNVCATSINVIFFISLDRFLCLCYPFEYPLKRTDAISKIALVVIWIVTWIFYSVYLGATQIMLADVRDIYNCNAYFLNSVPATFILIFLVLWAPIFGTMIMYILIYRIAAKVANAQKTNKMGKIASAEGGAKTGEKSGEDELKAVKTIGLLLITFVICWLPITFGYCGTALFPDSMNPWFLVGCYWLAYLNSTINPICYALGNPFFKETLKKLFSKRSY